MVMRCSMAGLEEQKQILEASAVPMLYQHSPRVLHRTVLADAAPSASGMCNAGFTQTDNLNDFLMMDALLLEPRGKMRSFKAYYAHASVHGIVQYLLMLNPQQMVSVTQASHRQTTSMTF